MILEANKKQKITDSMSGLLALKSYPLDFCTREGRGTLILETTICFTRGARDMKKRNHELCFYEFKMLQGVF